MISFSDPDPVNRGPIRLLRFLATVSNLDGVGQAGRSNRPDLSAALAGREDAVVRVPVMLVGAPGAAAAEGACDGKASPEHRQVHRARLEGSGALGIDGQHLTVRPDVKAQQRPIQGGCEQGAAMSSTGQAVPT